jgi:TonB family protein
MSYQALLFCPDDKTARVVTQVLTELDFTVEPCNEPFAAVKKLMAQHFDAVVVDCDNEQNAALLFKSARNSGSNQNSLAVAVVEGQAGVAKAFRIGANLVLTKPINVEQSKGTLRVARGLLRKADSGKPAGNVTPEAKAPASPISESPRPASPASAPVKPPVAAFTTPKPTAAPPAHIVNESGFEREADPGPKPEPTEAALLESMSDPAPAAKTYPATTPAKEYPWQPVSKLAEPMASALRLAAETATKSSGAEPGAETSAPNWGAPGETGKDHWPGQVSNQGAASAPAPAKQESKRTAQLPEFEESAAAAQESKPEPLSSKGSLIPMEAPQIEPPTFAALAVKDHEDTEAGSKKAYVIIALVVLAAIFTAYIAYQKMHASSGPAPAVLTAPAPAPAPGAGSVSAGAAAPTVPQAEPAPQEITLSTTKTSEPHGKKTESDVTVTKPSAAIHNPPPAETSAEPSAPAPEPILVKHEAAAAAPKHVEPDVAPPQAIVMPSDNKELSGIAAVSTSIVAKPVATTLKVSQGVSQGLLIKRVQPVYPSQAMQMRIEGTVLLDATITKEGKISNVKVVKGDDVLAKAAVDAVKQWKYNPYFLNGEPVPIQTQVNITFKLP